MLFQEYLKDDPFWMLVACCLVNKTQWKQAQSVFENLKQRWPTPEALAGAEIDDVYRSVWQLGLGDRRSKHLVALAKSFLSVRPKTAFDVKKLDGCGKYASDSWAIFVDNDLSVEVTDKELTAYLRKSRSNMLRL